MFSLSVRFSAFIHKKRIAEISFVHPDKRGKMIRLRLRFNTAEANLLHRGRTGDHAVCGSIAVNKVAAKGKDISRNSGRIIGYHIAADYNGRTCAANDTRSRIVRYHTVFDSHRRGDCLHTRTAVDYF